MSYENRKAGCRRRARAQLVYRFPGDELAGHDLHGLPDRRPHERLSRARHQPAHHGVRAAVRIVPFDEPSREHQRPRRGVHQRAAAAFDLDPGIGNARLPPAAGELVADQRVGGLGVGYAQQRLREAHQDHAFARGQVVALQEGFRPHRLRRLRPHRRASLRASSTMPARGVRERQALARGATADASSRRYVRRISFQAAARSFLRGGVGAMAG